MNILTIGGATQDLSVYYPHQEMAYFDTPSGKQQFLLLLEGAKIELESVAYFPGGGAHNAAVSYARQEFDTSIICVVGTDCPGDSIIDNLNNNNVSTRFVTRISDKPTGFSFIIRLKTGDRTVLVNRGANSALAEHHFSDQAFVGIDQLYITSLGGSAAALLPSLALKARQRGIPVAVNPGSSQLRAGADSLRQALSSIDTLILNSYEATLLMSSLQQAAESDGKPAVSDHPKLPKIIASPLLLDVTSSLDIALFCSRVNAYGTKIVAVTNGAEGVYVSTQDCLYFYPSKPIKVVSTLGAGDAFGSGFVGHLARGGTVEQAIRYGMANSHAVIADCGAQTGLLSGDALGKAAQALDPSLLQTFDLSFSGHPRGND
ncbi:carbohydrate kinase family protein [Candidatus Dependentiae bacterium]|nr:carbohydrate kinase family protein [Candidatus Dependentiae bacterium]